MSHKGQLWADSTRTAMVAMSERQLSPEKGEANVDLEDRLEYDFDSSIPHSGTETSEMARMGNRPPGHQSMQPLQLRTCMAESRALLMN